ncbi:unnamed protein product, partial [Discosporangium mesarthrocarpum]
MALVFIDEVVFKADSSSAFSIIVEAISTVRFIRIGSVFNGVRELIFVTVKSATVVIPLLLVMLLLTYFWAVTGVIAFGNDRYLDNLFGDGNEWETVNRHQGFHGVMQGMQTMFGVATTPGSDGWGYQDVTPAPWKWAVVLFFTSYAFFTRYLIFNLFMMTLLFKYKIHSEDKVGVAMEQVNQFKRAWIGQAFIHTKEYGSVFAHQLVTLLKELPPPLGIGSEGSHYDCQILAKKVLSSLGVKAVKDVAPHDLCMVIRPGGGLGELRLGFSEVLIAVHRILAFGATLEDERKIKEARSDARMNLSILKLGHSQAADPTDSRAMREASLVRTQLPNTFMVRSTMALTAELLRWRNGIDLKGYGERENLEGLCFLSGVKHELGAAIAQEKLMASLFDRHVGDRRLLDRLTSMKQHIATLKDLQSKVELVRGDYQDFAWDPEALVVKQVIDDEGATGVTGVASSSGGEWIFCTTEGKRLKVFRKKRPRKSGKIETPREGSYGIVQSMELRGEQQRRSVRGLCVACAPDGRWVCVGCEDSTARFFFQDVAGWKQTVQAMKAAGLRGPKPPMKFKSGAVGRGHKGPVTCVLWHELYVFTGSADGTIKMWKRGAKQHIQSANITKNAFASKSVRCLAIWHAVYDLPMMAACIEVDEHQDVVPPAYLLAGDDNGNISVLPIRTDTKFFAVDVWKIAFRQMVHRQGGVTAVEVAWGRIYTASGSMGVIRVWSPHWEDSRKEKLMDLTQAGQFTAHSGPVTSIKYAKGIMLSASEDLSIVTWHPPEAPLEATTSRSPPLQRTKHPALLRGKNSPIAQEQDSVSMSGSNSDIDPKPVSEEGILPSDVVEHRKDPGFIYHTDCITCMVVIGDVAISGDKGGRLLVRGPDKLREIYCVKVLPEEEEMRSLMPLAVEAVKARGCSQALSPSSNTKKNASKLLVVSFRGDTALVALASMANTRFLCRAKARRLHKEASAAQAQEETNLRVAEEFARKMENKQGLDQGPDSRYHRRRSIMQSVSCRKGKFTDGHTCVSVTATGPETKGDASARRGSLTDADMERVVELDRRPAFLDGSLGPVSAENGEVYIAQLMHHFFPGKSLESDGKDRFSGSAACTLASATGGRGAAGAWKGAELCGLGRLVRRRAASVTGGRIRGRRTSLSFPNDDISNGGDQQLQKRRLSICFPNNPFPYTGKKGEEQAESKEEEQVESGVLVHSSSFESVTLAAEGKMNISTMKDFGEPEAPNKDVSDGEHEIGDYGAGAAGEMELNLSRKKPNQRSGMLSSMLWEGSDGTRDVGLTSGDYESELENMSTLAQRQRGFLTVFIPLPKGSGTWAASIPYCRDRDVAWVLGETLRMYEREHPPLTHLGLALREAVTGGIAGGSGSSGGKYDKLTLSASVPSVLKPGDELVVLVEGCNPVQALSRRAS